MRSLNRALCALLAVVVGLVLGFGAPPSSERRAEAVVSPDKPNIVLVVTDDQRADTLSVMPNVQNRLVDPGVKFSNGFVVNPLCCPARASFLTGKYSHGTGVYSNSGPFGGYASFKSANSTIATWLTGEGYRTALVGKYFNGYTKASYVPPGWHHWTSFVAPPGGGAYYNYKLSKNGVTIGYGDTPADYSTDVLADDATSFIKDTPPGKPLFLYFTPNAPHAPALPAPRHATALAGTPNHRPPSYNEADVSDKPAYIRARDPGKSDTFRLKQLRTLLAVDDAVGQILDTLQAEGRLENTIFVFSSDNGILWSEHRWSGKSVPYEESIRVPFVVRYDQLVDTPHTDSNLVTNIDVAPTFAALAGISAPGAEGEDFTPLLTTPGAPWRDDFLIEHIENPPKDIVPTYCGVRSRNHSYVAYKTGEKELYDLNLDPYQLTNRAGDPAYADVERNMLQRLREMCSPPPPGYTVP